MYKFVGTIFFSSISFNRCGVVPFVTRNAVMPLSLISLISSTIFGYNVGSPSSEIAKCDGSIASASMCFGVFSLPPKPFSNFLCDSIEELTISFGESHLFSDFARSLPNVRQHHEHEKLQKSNVGVICTHLWLLIP